MRTIVTICLVLAAPVLLQGEEQAVKLKVEIVPRFAGAALDFDSITNATAAGQRISVTRLDFLLSGFSWRRTGGGWIDLTNSFAYISAREGRTSFDLESIPTGQYNRLRFRVGVGPEINRQDPAGHAAGHPLNPNLNGLHWGWMGGYVFLALEGDWLRRNDEPSGYSYHLATDRQLMIVEVPITIDLASESTVRIALHLDQIFGGQHLVEISDATASSHSRSKDDLADKLRRNVEAAFAVEHVGATEEAMTDAATDSSAGVEMAPNATPYRLTLSQFFPRPVLPADNPITDEGVALGRQLFFEPLLSVNNSQSCSSCHQAESAFGDPRRFSRGAEGQIGERHSMPLFNLAWKSSFFWDGRAASLREQVLQPIENPVEMGETLMNVIAKLAGSSRDNDAGGKNVNYSALFANAFGTTEITADRIARALEQFLLIHVSYDSKFDRVLTGRAELSQEEQRGFELFHTEYDPRRGQYGADCFHCHGGPLFQNVAFANNGLDAIFADEGRASVTGKSGDKGKFAVPTLRNVAVTAPYMHDGRLATLEEVVEHYRTGVQRSATLDPNLAKHPVGGVPLSNADKAALIAFLKTLTDERFLSKQGQLATGTRVP